MVTLKTSEDRHQLSIALLKTHFETEPLFTSDFVTVANEGDDL